MTRLDIRTSDLAVVKQILASALPPHAHIWVFGSRTKGKAKPWSDLDLAIDAKKRLTK